MSDKERIFELMKKLGYKPLNEVNVVDKNIDGVIDSDIEALAVANKGDTTLKNARTHINTMNEFPEAFKMWFASLGYKPTNPTITIPRVLDSVRKVMKELGYK